VGSVWVPFFFILCCWGRSQVATDIFSWGGTGTVFGAIITKGAVGFSRATRPPRRSDGFDHVTYRPAQDIKRFNRSLHWMDFEALSIGRGRGRGEIIVRLWFLAVLAVFVPPSNWLRKRKTGLRQVKLARGGIDLKLKQH
jgi:hypothetical protein